MVTSLPRCKSEGNRSMNGRLTAQALVRRVQKWPLFILQIPQVVPACQHLNPATVAAGKPSAGALHGNAGVFAHVEEDRPRCSTGDRVALDPDLERQSVRRQRTRRSHTSD